MVSTPRASPRRSASAGHPIPDAALDDRLAFVGTAGSGKTYAAGTAVERLLDAGARVVIPDPLGVWHGLRLRADGKTPAFPVVIFGGPHGDLPLTELAGALIGEAAATMAESCIIDLSELGTKASERRFMLAFLTALYRKTEGEPLHVVFDEADMWAPQTVSDKDGDATKLLGMMETIVRRGRIKGFIPWLITQRPAVLNKNVLSQADGLVALKLTASQDRGALGDWIEGQADRAEGKRILGEMPTLQRGQAVVWLPARGVLETAQFPKKQTFDSSRTPARGEAKRTLTLKPLDLDALKSKLEQVEAEIKANDPKALKAEVAKLKRDLAAAEAKAHAPSPNAQAADAIRREAFAEGAQSREHEITDAYRKGFDDAAEKLSRAIATLSAPPAPPPKKINPPAAVVARARSTPMPPPQPKTTLAPADTAISGPQAQMLKALAWWKAMGNDAPSRAQVAVICGWSITSGHIGNVASSLKTAGLIEYAGTGLLALTGAGEAAAPEPDRHRGFRESLRNVLDGPQRLMFDVLLQMGGRGSREDVAIAAGWSTTSGHTGNVASSLRTMGVLDYPKSGELELTDWAMAE